MVEGFGMSFPILDPAKESGNLNSGRWWGCQGESCHRGLGHSCSVNKPWVPNSLESTQPCVIFHPSSRKLQKPPLSALLAIYFTCCHNIDYDVCTQGWGDFTFSFTTCQSSPKWQLWLDCLLSGRKCLKYFETQRDLKILMFIYYLYPWVKK